MALTDEAELAQYQSLLQQAGQIAEDEKSKAEGKFKSHLQEIKQKFAEHVKIPLEEISGPLLFESGKDIIKKGVSKVLSLSPDTEDAINNLIENKDVSGFANHIVDKLVQVRKNAGEDIDDILARPADEDDTEGFGSMIKRKLGDLADKIKSKFTKKSLLPKQENIENYNPYQDPFSTGSVDEDIIQLAQKGALRKATILQRFRETDATLSPRENLNLGIERSRARLIQLKGKQPSVTPTTDSPDNGGPADAEPQPPKPPSPEPVAKEVEKGGEKVGKKIATVGEEAGEDTLEAETIGGGPEDPFGDIVAGIVGITTLLSGLFSKKKHLPKAPPIQTLHSTVQFGV